MPQQCPQATLHAHVQESLLQSAVLVSAGCEQILLSPGCNGRAAIMAYLQWPLQMGKLASEGEPACPLTFLRNVPVLQLSEEPRAQRLTSHQVAGMPGKLNCQPAKAPAS